MIGLFQGVAIIGFNPITNGVLSIRQLCMTVSPMKPHIDHGSTTPTAGGHVGHPHWARTLNALVPCLVKRQTRRCSSKGRSAAHPYGAAATGGVNDPSVLVDPRPRLRPPDMARDQAHTPPPNRPTAVQNPRLATGPRSVGTMSELAEQG
jgi:hypothetical protein